MFIVSACLAGFCTRFDGTSRLDERAKALVSAGRAIALCPEQLGGLATPRVPVEIDSGNGMDVIERRANALTKDGRDISSSLIKGAEETLKIARLYNVKTAVLKDGSPSCGVTYVYNNGQKIGGMGVAAAMLDANGIKVATVDSI